MVQFELIVARVVDKKRLHYNYSISFAVVVTVDEEILPRNRVEKRN